MPIPPGIPDDNLIGLTPMRGFEPPVDVTEYADYDPADLVDAGYDEYQPTEDDYAILPVEGQNFTVGGSLTLLKHDPEGNVTQALELNVQKGRIDVSFQYL
jgi:hypothetical protein